MEDTKMHGSTKFKFHTKGEKYTRDMYIESWNRERTKRVKYFTHTLVSSSGNSSIEYYDYYYKVTGEILARQGEEVPEDMIAEYKYVDGSCPFDTHEMSVCPEANGTPYVGNIAVKLYGRNIHDELQCRLMYFDCEEAQELINHLQSCLDQNKHEEGE